MTQIKHTTHFPHLRKFCATRKKLYIRYFSQRSRRERWIEIRKGKKRMHDQYLEYCGTVDCLPVVNQLVPMIERSACTVRVVYDTSYPGSYRNRHSKGSVPLRVRRCPKLKEFF